MQSQSPSAYTPTSFVPAGLHICAAPPPTTTPAANTRMSTALHAARGPNTGIPSPTRRPSPPNRHVFEAHAHTDNPLSSSPVSVGFTESTPEAAMDQFLESHATTLQRLLDVCARAAMESDMPFAPTVTATAFPSSLLHPRDGGTSTPSSAGAAAAPIPSPQHRSRVIADLIRRDRESQWAAEVGRSARLEREKLKRATDLEAARLTLLQRKNVQLRARLEALTQEHREAAAQRGRSPLSISNSSSSSTALVVATGLSTQLTLTGLPTAGGMYTNRIVEARRRLDQRTQELQEVQERLRQLQEHHLGQLSGQLRPMLFAEDALRTTENFLDTETNMAVRATVVDALLEVNQALKPLAASDDGDAMRTGAVLPCLEAINSLWDRLAVQNFVVGRVNRLFTCMCPTAPPLTLLKDANMM